MQDFKKISLSPTRFFKNIAPEAVGSALISAEQRISLNIFNLPDPKTNDEGKDQSYKGWLFDPESGVVQAIGTLAPAGDNLYFLYDRDVDWRAGFSEVIITSETVDSKEPYGEILLIGYLAAGNSKPLEPFQPFSSEMPNHRWWKEKKNLHARVPAKQMNPCTQCTHWQQSCVGRALPKKESKEFDLPNLIGVMTDDSGNVQYIVHGIPGRLLRADQPDQGKTGYLYWQPYYGFEERIGAMGYWLCYIDPRTNQVQTPQGVILPPG